MSDLLKLAPAGQVEQMAADLTALTAKDYTEQIVNYYEDNFTILKVNNLPVMVSKFNKRVNDGETTYSDINGIFKLDRCEAVKISDATENELNKLVNELQLWINDFYPNGIIRVFEYEEGHEICINSTAVKSTAYWSSHWISHYHLPKDGKVTATVKLLIHYYEDGNVQMNANKTFTVDPLKEFNVKSVLDLIKTVEHKYHEQVKTVDMTETFKNLRRQLPLTKQEIEWEKVFCIHLGSRLFNDEQERNK
eukprot:NODE_285_length_11794_cov_0.197178.p5 type:complete len:250 gc:universal NODE_285_length_11794_cov_0.197178:4222-4971(+)